ncbi:MAG: hypothetical protein RR364_07680 [Lachnospiraceae bacterium]
MSKKEEVRILNESFKNARMGCRSIHTLLPKIYDEEFAYELNCEADVFDKISKKAAVELKKRGVKPEDLPRMVHLMTWASIQRKTLLNTSTSHMADMMIQGNVKGMTELMQAGHAIKKSGTVGIELAQELMEFEEKNIEKLKRYL